MFLNNKTVLVKDPPIRIFYSSVNCELPNFQSIKYGFFLQTLEIFKASETLG